MGKKSQEAYYAKYRSSNLWKSNREKRLNALLKKLEAAGAPEKHLEKLMDAMSDMKYRRKTPTTPQWSHSQIAVAKLLKEFSGSAPQACFSSNPQVANMAIAGLFRKHDNKTVPEGKVDFSLAARSYSRKPV